MLVDDEVFNIFAVQGLMRILGLDKRVKVDVCYNGE